MTSNLPYLQPHLVLGLQTQVTGNLNFLSDDEVVYPVGAVVAVHNYTLKRQKFIRISDKGKNLTHIAISPDKKLIAVVETTEKLPVVTLWCPESFRRKRTLSLPTDKDIVAGRYSAIDFTFDSARLVCVTDEPDSNLYCFKCDKGRLESFARANNVNGTGTVTQVACNPNDHNQVAVVGDSVLRCLGCVDYTWRQFGYSKFEPVVYTSCCWLSQDRLMVGGARGDVLIFETGELRAVFHASDMPVINMKLREFERTSQTSLKSIPVDNGDPNQDGENYEIRSIVNFARGFAFGFMNGRVHLYERQTPHKFRKRAVFRIPDRTVYREYDDSRVEVKTGVNCIRVNAAQDRILVTCGETQIYQARLWSQSETADGCEVEMTEYGYPQHLGSVGTMAICRWKPICVTAGAKDRCLKVWNYESGDLELARRFEDDVHSAALHPTGLYCVIGFSDRLRYMTIMIDDVVTVREFGIRNCKLSAFSTLGHLFASTNGNILQVYSSVTFELMYVLKGHNGKIASMSWSRDDRLLATCGSEGALYIWDVVESARMAEIIIKSNPFTGVAMTSTGKEVYAVGMDGRVKEIAGSTVQRDVALVESGGLDGLTLSQLDTMLFVTGAQGTVFSLKLPLLERAEFVECIMHRKAITNMCLTYDDKYLISGGADGMLCFWKVTNAEEKAIRPDKEMTSANEILISKQILEDKMDKIANLQLRLRELETEHLYQMRQADALHSLRMKDIHSEYCHAIEELKIKNEQMEGEHVQEINTINSQISKMKMDHELLVQKLEASYNEKLIVEYKKFARHEEKTEKLLEEQRRRYEALEKLKAESEESVDHKNRAMLGEKDQIIDELRDKMATLIAEHELIKQQIEDDCDREICELKTTHAKEIRDEQELNVRLRGEAAVTMKKLLATQKESEGYKQEVAALEKEHAKFKGVIAGLEKDVCDIKKEIAERDSTIEDKERRIFQLKSKNQELEKFKFILDFKIKELKSQVEPRERTIQEQTTQINEMVRELENLQKVTLNLDAQLAEDRSKLAGAAAEVRREVERNWRMKKALREMRMDLHRASGLIQNVPMLQKAVKEMYHKYNADKDFEVIQAEDTEAKGEFLRQREFLERTVATLHKQATKHTSTLSFDKIRLVGENASLLVETNQLRKNLQTEIVQNKKLNALIGLSYISPQVAQRKVDLAIATNREIYEKYWEQIEQNNKVIQALRDENERLTNKIAETSGLVPSGDADIEDEAI
ncbi:cilia- and flagella-associated protein 57 [Cylas formicarius]|uniref:cilia- and flagella-associated protein 57 n=1 Tax=Cylas formicarius TaxID=197179 RepID=UPI00295864BD|nr:cilia- and flagella-associated protein 57 [Cylas formicarius]